MEAQKREALAHLRQRMEQAVRWAPELLEAIERAGFQITHIRHQQGPCWFVRATPPPPLQEGLGLGPEILVVAVRGEIQAKTLRAARAEVVVSGLRLDGNLVIVCDEGAGLQNRLDRFGGHGQRIAWVKEHLGAFPSLVEVLRHSLPTFDVYEERDAVRGAQLIGRAEELADLKTRVMRGDAVGLFGLRKIGKTSLMRALTDWYDPVSGIIEAQAQALEPSVGVAIVVDASLVMVRTVDALCDELLSVVRRRMSTAEEPIPDRSTRGLLGWKAVGENILDGGRPLCVVIDEYDLLFEGESGEGAVAGVGKLFRLLRGWAQTRQGQVSLILVGRDPTPLMVTEIEGVSNPLAAWYTPMWLGPLQPLKAVELLRKLGKRVGLDVGAETAEMAARWTGGHPLLHRQFGSAIRRLVRETDPAWGAKTDPYLGQAPARFQEQVAVLEVMREIADLLGKRYPGSLGILNAMAHGEGYLAAVGAYGGPDSVAARILRDFGLLSREGRCADAFLQYLRRERPRLPDRVEAHL